MKLSRKDRELMRLALMDSVTNRTIDYSEHEISHMTKLYRRLRKINIPIL